LDEGGKTISHHAINWHEFIWSCQSLNPLQHKLLRWIWPTVRCCLWPVHV